MNKKYVFQPIALFYQMMIQGMKAKDSKLQQVAVHFYLFLKFHELLLNLIFFYLQYHFSPIF